MNTPLPKYRIALTPQQVAYLISCCKTEGREELLDIATTTGRQLELVQAKIQIGVVKPAFESTPPISLEEKLGIEAATPTEKRFAAYRKYQGNPSICTPQEVKLARTYMYENGMMSTQESEEFENE